MKPEVGHRQCCREDRADWLLRRAISACALAATRCLREARALTGPDQHAARHRAVQEAESFVRLSARLAEAMVRLRPRVTIITVERWKNGTLVSTRTTRRGDPSDFPVRMPAPQATARAPRPSADDGRLSAAPVEPVGNGEMRARGAQPGNANRLVHGRYSRTRLAAQARAKRDARAALALVANMRKAHRALMRKRNRPSEPAAASGKPTYSHDRARPAPRPPGSDVPSVLRTRRNQAAHRRRSLAPPGSGPPRGPRTDARILSSRHRGRAESPAADAVETGFPTA